MLCALDSTLNLTTSLVKRCIDIDLSPLKCVSNHKDSENHIINNKLMQKILFLTNASNENICINHCIISFFKSITSKVSTGNSI